MFFTDKKKFCRSKKIGAFKSTKNEWPGRVHLNILVIVPTFASAYLPCIVHYSFHFRGCGLAVVKILIACMLKSFVAEISM